ncbi:glycerophosphodiester phosphodiesterase [Ureibacillus manganicus]|uniref:Glycerophosphodiester phosphodiesterase n=1 Tax=Ureibacillus manganicus DSM 26584 TaxID=1384049 RepID=A0A0A3I561_9BACL|nr:glycerophosphodiester phosphodiesterase family protein [Ureibacillus manganicus]KGR79859.1 glycerophosphodiester phosphodiesterase [Ureibacillus manganicus DSM 26584]
MKKTVTVIFLSVIIIIGTVTATVLSFAEETIIVDAQENMINIAHRGASAYAPENTMAAFTMSVEMGADYIEFDVQMTKDGIPVVIHDLTVDRTTNGYGSLNTYTLDKLKSLDAGSWFSKEFAGETIPTLDEVLTEFGGKISILIELKFPEVYPGIEVKVANALKEHNLVSANSNQIIIQSFNHESIKLSKELLPDIPHGVLVRNDWKGVSDRQLEEFATYADYFNPNFNMVTAELVERVHFNNMTMFPYTIKKQSLASKLYNLGVDGIITDDPDILK